ncbi:hypothetical protein AN232_04900 [Citrobacter sp. CRE-46]|nr:hypothetical protein AN232_04900 [Citrobacter sp. CRE-46]
MPNEKTHYKKTSNHAALSNLLNKQIQYRVTFTLRSPPVNGGTTCFSRRFASAPSLRITFSQRLLLHSTL